MANQMANAIKLMLWKGQVDVDTDTMKIMLMDLGFEFDQDSHKEYSDVSSFEIPSGNGYTTGGATLTLDAATVDNTENRAEVTYDNVQWIASGGALATVGAIIYDDSTSVSGGDDYDKAIICWIDANGQQTVADGAALTISNIMLTGEDITTVS